MSAKVGDAVVTCPSCGESLSIDVTLSSATLGLAYVLISLDNVRCEHTCKGRA